MNTKPNCNILKEEKQLKPKRLRFELNIKIEFEGLVIHGADRTGRGSRAKFL
jgi:hypothetical protein